MLRCIGHLDESTAAFMTDHAPWLRYVPTRTSGQVYLAHHCTTCGVLQGIEEEGTWTEKNDNYADYRDYVLNELGRKPVGAEELWKRVRERMGRALNAALPRSRGPSTARQRLQAWRRPGLRSLEAAFPSIRPPDGIR